MEYLDIDSVDRRPDAMEKVLRRIGARPVDGSRIPPGPLCISWICSHTEP